MKLILILIMDNALLSRSNKIKVVQKKKKLEGEDTDEYICMKQRTNLASGGCLYACIFEVAASRGVLYMPRYS